VLKWVQAFKGDWTKTREYAAMLDFEAVGIDGIAEAMDILYNEQKESYLAKSTFKKFAESAPFDKLTNDEIQKLISIAQDTLEDGATARSLIEKLHFDQMEEPAKLALAREYLEVDVAIARQIYDQLADKEAAKLELFEHCVKSGDTSEAISLAGELAEIEKYAEKFALKKAELLEAAKRYSEAIAAYRQCGSEPAYLWRIVECHLALDQPEEAIEQLRAIATAHKDQAAKAVYRIADLYGDAEQEEKQIATLREIVKKYPTSDEADKAEQELGEMGIPPALPAPPSLDL
jgi:tetratricopeptide (TPR) repeat protein